MKKLIFTAAGIICFTVMSVAQEPAEAADKEQKMAIKEKKDNNLDKAFSAIHLTDDERAKAIEIFSETNKKLKELKRNEKMNDEERAVAIKAINELTNVRLQELMDKDRYKLFIEIRKKQEAAMEESKSEEDGKSAKEAKSSQEAKSAKEAGPMK